MLTRSEIEWLENQFYTNQSVTENEFIGAGYSWEEADRDRNRAEAIFNALLKLYSV